MIDSSYRLQTQVVDPLRLGAMGAQPHPKQFLQNALFSLPLRQDENHSLWVENSRIQTTWTLASEHALTGVPPNDWTLRMERGQCLDFVPVGATAWAVRAYGMDDLFRSDCASSDTIWMGQPAVERFRARGLEDEWKSWAGTDLQRAPLHPEIPASCGRRGHAPSLVDRAPPLGVRSGPRGEPRPPGGPAEPLCG